jgi:hypothetical protein
MSGKNGATAHIHFTTFCFLHFDRFVVDALPFTSLCDCPACTLRPSHRHLLTQAATLPSYERTGSELHISRRHDANHRRYMPHVYGCGRCLAYT